MGKPNYSPPPSHICGCQFDIQEEYRRNSTILQVSGNKKVDSVKGYINDNRVSADVEHSEYDTISAIIYGIGSEPKTADIVPWQGFDKEHNQTISHEIPKWKHTPQGKEIEAVYITFHVIDKDGKIGPAVITKIDESSDSRRGFIADVNVQEEIGSGPIFDPASADSKNPPSETTEPPLIIATKKYSVFSAYVEFEPRDSNALYHVYSVSSEPEGNDLIHSQSLGRDDRRTSWRSMAEMGLKQGDTFFINVWAATPTGYGPISTSEPLTFQWDTLGEGTITYNYSEKGLDADGKMAEGWTQAEKEQLQDFCEKMDPIIREVYGPPSQDMDLKLIKDERYSGSNVFLAGTNEILMSEIGKWQLLTHEILHAFHGHIHFENNGFWKFDNKLMGFEEGFAHAVSYICMNKYGKAHPTDPKGLNGYTHWQPYTLADYDYRNDSHLTTAGFWSPNGHGMGLAFERYEMAASVFFKFFMEDNNFFKIFNQKYCHALNNDPNTTVSKLLLVKIAEASVAQVEGMPTGKWIDRQRILDCEYKYGDKIRMYSFVETLHNEFASKNTLYHYQTFQNGSDWYYRPTETYHQYNTRRAIFEVRKASTNSYLNSGELFPTPAENPPPIERGFAFAGLHLSTKGRDSVLIPHEEGKHFRMIGITDPLELFNIRVIYDGSSDWIEFFRLVGTDLENPKQMICGAFKDFAGGEVTLTHLDPDFLDKPVTVPVNGNTWSAVVPWEYGADSSAPHLKKFPMGKVRIEYKDLVNDKRYVAFKNLGFGEKNEGLNLLLIDKAEMEEVLS